MPVYEYVCHDCRRRVRLRYSYDEYDTAVPVCPNCQSTHLTRHIGRVALAKSEDARLDAMADDSMLSDLDESDPRSLGRFMRRMSHEMGEDLGEEFGEVVDRLEKGQSPEEIEQAMPDLAGDGFDDGPGGLGGLDDF